MKRRITVVGSSNLDRIMQLERLPAIGETVAGGTFTQAYGGKGANQAVAAARAGGRVSFVTCLGDDPDGMQMLASFQAEGIQTDSILTASETPTGTALILLDRQGRNMIAVAPGANDALTAEHIEARADLIRESACIVLQLEIPPPTAQRVLELAARHGVPVLFNYAPVREGELSVTAAMTGLIVNEVEAARLTGMPVESIEQAGEAAEALRSRGPQFVVLTLGAAGAYLASSEWREPVAGFSVQAVDTTAAGDAFCGALAVAQVEGASLRDSVRFASAAAAISVTRLGAQPSLPTRREIDRFLRTVDAGAP